MISPSGRALEIISLAGNTHRTVTELVDANRLFGEHWRRSPPRPSYAARKHATNSMDFDDLLQLWLN